MNETRLKPQKEPNLSRSVGISVLLHIGILVFFTVQTLVFPSEPIEFSRAVRVDIVDLPDKLPQAPPAPKPPAPKAPEPPKPTPPKPEPPKPAPPKPAPTPKPAPPKPEAPKVDLDKARSKQQEALNRLKTQSAIEKLKQQQTQEDSTPEPAEYKGAVLSPVSSLTGLNQLQHDRYISDFDEHVRGYWRIPEWLANGEWSARVLVKINEQGYVTSAKIVKSSGNPTYDELVLGTVQKASPYPAPPEKFKDILAYDGITLGFPE